MSYILNLETATTICSITLTKNGEEIHCIEENSGNYSHAENLNPFIEKLLKEAKITVKDLNAIAISKGPGSYTGLRIGVSSAKGLCYALDIPLIAVSSLKVLANLVEVDKDTLICPMFDARRMEVYTCLFSSTLEMVSPVEAKVIDENSFSEILANKKIKFIGPGANKCQEIIQNSNAMFDLETQVSAKGMNQLTYKKFLAKDFEDLAYFEPNYLKDFIAGKPKKLV